MTASGHVWSHLENRAKMPPWVFETAPFGRSGIPPEIVDTLSSHIGAQFARQKQQAQT
jgi:hypothetical protein